jgi:hypothetical protein
MKTAGMGVALTAFAVCFYRWFHTSERTVKK